MWRLPKWHASFTSIDSRRRDFLDPDFGVKASLRLASRKRCNCNVDAEADSEIPELGLDGGRLNVDCQVNPMRVADAAFKVARNYNQYRRDRSQRRPASSQRVKRKGTRITLDRDYVRLIQPNDEESDDSDSSSSADHRDEDEHDD